MVTAYLTPDRVQAYEHYGVKVTSLGEDGDMGEVAFTHDRRRAIAAVCAMYRKDVGERVREVFVGKTHWWRIVNRCGCGEQCPCPADADGYVEHNCQHHGLPPCRDDGAFWMGLVCNEEDPGALPVTTMEVGVW